MKFPGFFLKVFFLGLTLHSSVAFSSSLTFRPGLIFNHGNHDGAGSLRPYFSHTPPFFQVEGFTAGCCSLFFVPDPFSKPPPSTGLLLHRRWPGLLCCGLGCFLLLFSGLGPPLFWLALDPHTPPLPYPPPPWSSQSPTFTNFFLVSRQTVVVKSWFPLFLTLFLGHPLIERPQSFRFGLLFPGTHHSEHPPFPARVFVILWNVLGPQPCS